MVAKNRRDGGRRLIFDSSATVQVLSFIYQLPDQLQPGDPSLGPSGSAVAEALEGGSNGRRWVGGWALTAEDVAGAVRCQSPYR